MISLFEYLAGQRGGVLSAEKIYLACIPATSGLKGYTLVKFKGDDGDDGEPMIPVYQEYTGEYEPLKGKPVLAFDEETMVPVGPNQVTELSTMGDFDPLFALEVDPGECLFYCLPDDPKSLMIDAFLAGTMLRSEDDQWSDGSDEDEGDGVGSKKAPKKASNLQEKDALVSRDEGDIHDRDELLGRLSRMAGVTLDGDLVQLVIVDGDHSSILTGPYIKQNQSSGGNNAVARLLTAVSDFNKFMMKEGYSLRVKFLERGVARIGVQFSAGAASRKQVPFSPRYYRPLLADPKNDQFLDSVFGGPAGPYWSGTLSEVDRLLVRDEFVPPYTLRDAQSIPITRVGRSYPPEHLLHGLEKHIQRHLHGGTDEFILQSGYVGKMEKVGTTIRITWSPPGTKSIPVVSEAHLAQMKDLIIVPGAPCELSDGTLVQMTTTGLAGLTHKGVTYYPIRYKDSIALVTEPRNTTLESVANKSEAEVVVGSFCFGTKTSVPVKASKKLLSSAEIFVLEDKIRAIVQDISILEGKLKGGCSSADTLILSRDLAGKKIDRERLEERIAAVRDATGGDVRRHPKGPGAPPVTGQAPAGKSSTIFNASPVLGKDTENPPAPNTGVHGIEKDPDYQDALFGHF